MEEPRGLAAALMSTRSALDQADEKAIETALTTLAMSLGASRIETGTIKALRAVVLQRMRPMPDRAAWEACGASKSNFMKWKARLRDEQSNVEVLAAARVLTLVR